MIRRRLLPDRHVNRLLYVRRGDRLADRRERRAVVELEILANPLQSEVAP